MSSRCTNECTVHACCPLRLGGPIPLLPAEADKDKGRGGEAAGGVEGEVEVRRGNMT